MWRRQETKENTFMFDIEECELNQDLECKYYKIKSMYMQPFIYFLKDIYSFIQQWCSELFKSDSKDVYIILNNIAYKKCGL